VVGFDLEEEDFIAERVLEAEEEEEEEDEVWMGVEEEE
jgi:hypothetical protein